MARKRTAEEEVAEDKATFWDALEVIRNHFLSITEQLIKRVCTVVCDTYS